MTKFVDSNVLIDELHMHTHVLMFLYMIMQDYQSFRIGSDGNLQGVGLFINIEPRTGHLVSLLPFEIFISLCYNFPSYKTKTLCCN